MKKLILFSLLIVPLAASAYGTRNWLNHNQPSGWSKSGPTYSWGYNYRSRGRHTTVRQEEDVTGWMYNGNARNSSSAGIYHWKRAQKNF